jgi:hypothetical protein
MLPAHVYDEPMSEAQDQHGPAVMAPQGRAGRHVESGRRGASDKAVQLGTLVTGEEKELRRGCRRFQATDKNLSVDAILRQTSELAVLLQTGGLMHGVSAACERIPEIISCSA